MRGNSFLYISGTQTKDIDRRKNYHDFEIESRPIHVIMSINSKIPHNTLTITKKAQTCALVKLIAYYQ